MINSLRAVVAVVTMGAGCGSSGPEVSRANSIGLIGMILGEIPGAAGKVGGQWRGHEMVSRMMRERMLDGTAGARFTVRQYLGLNQSLSPFLGEFGGDARANGFLNGTPNALGALLWTEVITGFASDVANACGGGVAVPASPAADGAIDAPGDVGIQPDPSAGAASGAIVLKNKAGVTGERSFLCEVKTEEGRQEIWRAVIGDDDFEEQPSSEFQVWSQAVGTFGGDDTAQCQDAYLSLLLHPYFLLDR